MRSCRKNRRAVANATRTVAGSGGTTRPRKSEEKLTAEKLKTAISGPWARRGKRMRWYFHQRLDMNRFLQALANAVAASQTPMGAGKLALTQGSDDGQLSGQCPGLSGAG